MPQSSDARIAELSNIPEHSAEVATHQREAIHPGTGGDKNWESAPTQSAPAVSSLVHGKAAALEAKKHQLEAAGQLPHSAPATKSSQGGRMSPAVGFALGALGVGLAVLVRTKRRG